MQSIFNTRIILRNDNTLNWLANEHAILLRGEVGIEFLDSGRVKLKVGDGISSWAQLQYINEDINGDKSSIDILNGVLQIVGFDAAEVGAYLTKGADGVATWVLPDNSVIDSLVSAVDTLRVDLNGVQAIVGNAATEESPATGIFALLNEKANTSDVYTRNEVYNKDEIAALIGGVFKYCGSKESYADLPTSNQNIGDVWNIESDDVEHGIKAGDNVVWNGSDWDKLSSTINLSGYATKEDIEPIQVEVDKISKSYLTKTAAHKLFKDVKYEFIGLPETVLVDYKDSEIRVMCPSDMEWTFQNTPSDNPNADSLNYYAQFRVYAPNDDIVGFKEGDRGAIIDQTLYTFDSTFAGIDEFGRKYSVLWLALARYDTATETWNYYGKTSTTSKYLGWDYCVEWYNASGKKVDSSAIRINLSNESCHNTVEPFYMGNVVKDVSEEFAFEKDTRKLSINAIEQTKIIGLVDALNNKIEAIDLAGVVVPVENNIASIGFATTSIAGVIKSASDTDGNVTPNAVYVDETTGVGVVKTVNANSIVQDKGDVIIMNGGSASDSF